MIKVLIALLVLVLSLTGCKDKRFYDAEVISDYEDTYLGKGVYYSTDYYNEVFQLDCNYIEAPDDVDYSSSGGRLDIHINDNGEGITYRPLIAFKNVLDMKEYKTGDLLPTWTAFAEKTKTNIVEASNYSDNDVDNIYKMLNENEFKSQTDSSQSIDLFYNSITNINKMGIEGKAIDLAQYLDQMPYFNAFLEQNPSIKDIIQTNAGNIYYAPYIEEYNDVNNVLVMDSSLVRCVLNAIDFKQFDKTINGGSNPNENVLKKGSYTPFIHSEKNYPDLITKVKVLTNNDEVKELAVKQTKNIIVQQNEFLNDGCTGADLAKQFRIYLNSAYGDYIGEGKIFEEYSDIFCSESACYNVDELIALMRVIKANPYLITEDNNREIEIIIPNENSNEGINGISDLLQLWGVKFSSNDKLYFDTNGKLINTSNKPIISEAATKLSQLYEEGLIAEEFCSINSSNAKTYYLDKYFKQAVKDFEYGFMMYGNPNLTIANDMVDGIGTDVYKRVNSISKTYIKPILPPFTYWANDDSTSLYNHSNKKLIRHIDVNTCINTSWCIPKNTDNLAGALRLIDYLFSERGCMIQNFGPEEYWKQPKIELGDTVTNGYDSNKFYVTDKIPEVTPVIGVRVHAMMAANPMDLYKFMRSYVGCTHGIGHKKLRGLEIQSINGYGQGGLVAFEQSISAGLLITE